MTGAAARNDDRRRCPWCGDDPLYVRYHDEEWGVPVRCDRRLFEKIVLEGAQAGLSWITILRKRQRYREVFDGFDPARVARFDARKVERLLQDPGIVRNRQKVLSAIGNARAFLRLQEDGPFHEWLWAFVEGEPVVNRWRSMAQVPAKTPVSDAIARELKRAGFTFVGSTIVYAMMQSIGMVNDHLLDCWTRNRRN